MVYLYECVDFITTTEVWEITTGFQQGTPRIWEQLVHLIVNCAGEGVMIKHLQIVSIGV